MPWFENGTSLYIQGKLKQCTQVAQRNALALERIASHHIPMIGLDPSMVLAYRYEYPELLKDKYTFKVLLIQEWLAHIMPPKECTLKIKETVKTIHFNLLSHCTEQANCNEAQEQWQTVFASWGLKLIPQKTGCCGMAGAYGHELIHQEESKGLFELSWKPYFNGSTLAAHNLVDGYSCRAQIRYQTGYQVKHPVALLYDLITETK
jgi:Fe-S oxidoreductase